jgi:hypothetical protein
MPALLVTQARAAEQPDPRAVEVLNKLMEALLVKDDREALRGVLPLVHKSLLNAKGDDLSPSIRRFSYKKARQGVALYKVPVEITRVAKGKEQTIGFRQTAERGRVDRYFVAKRAGVSGLPAPLHVFFPADGGPPTVVNIGSL